MKARNGFVSNSSSSSFILKKIPEDWTTEQVYDFYGLKDGHGHNRLKKTMAELIIEEIKNKKYNPDGGHGFIDRFFKKKDREKFLNYYGFNFNNKYDSLTYDNGLAELNKIFENPDDYFEFSISDKSEYEAIGCAYKGSFITKNGIEINCH